MRPNFRTRIKKLWKLYELLWLLFLLFTNLGTNNLEWIFHCYETPNLTSKTFNERIEILSEEISSIFIKDTKNGKESSVRTLFDEGKYKDRLLSYKKRFETINFLGIKPMLSTWRSKRDSNSCRPFDLCWFSRPVP